jgi:hypothetical protein
MQPAGAGFNQSLTGKVPLPNAAVELLLYKTYRKACDSL